MLQIKIARDRECSFSNELAFEKKSTEESE